VGHGGLDGADARGGGVFAGFGVIVEEVWGAEEVVRFGIWGSVWWCRAYSVSSGRDMIAVISRSFS
jgi:hypothetical protein